MSSTFYIYSAAVWRADGIQLLSHRKLCLLFANFIWHPKQTNMLYLLWGLLNIGLFLFFILTCFRATKLVREKFGLFAAIIFVFGLLSFIASSNDDKGNNKPNSNQIRTWKFASEDSLDNNATFVMKVVLEKTLVSEYELTIKYGKDTEGRWYIPITANSSTSGFISGTNWRPKSIIVERTWDNNRFKYHVNGNVEWNLLGMSIVSISKNYEGVALVK